MEHRTELCAPDTHVVSPAVPVTCTASHAHTPRLPLVSELVCSLQMPQDVTAQSDMLVSQLPLLPIHMQFSGLT